MNTFFSEKENIHESIPQKVCAFINEMNCKKYSINNDNSIFKRNKDLS